MINANKSWLAMLALTLGLTVTGCNNMITVPAPDTQPIRNTSQDPNFSPEQATIHTPRKCPPFNPKVQKMCTMQYDPVCVKINTPTGISYRTAGNACSACNTAEAISYVPGQCN